MKYHVRVTYEDRKLGPGVGRSLEVEASNTWTVAKYGVQ